jgi:alanyl-tRNA synthetase
VLRRLVRRVLTTLWRQDPSRSLSDLPSRPVEHTVDHFGLPVGVEPVRAVLRSEQERFRDLVRRGRRVVNRRLSRGPLDDRDYQDLHETHGLPRELVRTLLDTDG